MYLQMKPALGLWGSEGFWTGPWQSVWQDSAEIIFGFLAKPVKQQEATKSHNSAVPQLIHTRSGPPGTCFWTLICIVVAKLDLHGKINES